MKKYSRITAIFYPKFGKSLTDINALAVVAEGVEHRESAACVVDVLLHEECPIRHFAFVRRGQSAINFLQIGIGFVLVRIAEDKCQMRFGNEVDQFLVKTEQLLALHAFDAQFVDVLTRKLEI